MTDYAITDHAVKRYIARVSPKSEFYAAKGRLQMLAPMSTPLKERTWRGQELRQIANPLCHLVCIREGRVIVVKTVLGPNEIGTEYDDDLIEAFTRVAVDTIKNDVKPHMMKGDIRRIIEELVEKSIDERLDRFMKKRGHPRP